MEIKILQVNNSYKTLKVLQICLWFYTNCVDKQLFDPSTFLAQLLLMVTKHDRMF